MSSECKSEENEHVRKADRALSCVSGAVCCFSGTEGGKGEKVLPARQSQGRSGPVGRLPGLPRHGPIRGDEAQGEGLKILSTLVERTGMFLDGNICLMSIF